MDRSPPRFFNRGPSPHLRLAFFGLLALGLLIVDARLGTLTALRQGIATVLYPLQRTLLVPRDAIALASEYARGVDALRAENAELRRLETVNAKVLLEAEQLAAENARLRELLGARERVATRSMVAEVLYETRDPYVRRIVIDRGLQHGVLPGQPVIDTQGVVGQVTRAQPLSSEVTLVTDRSAMLPVEIQRTGQRSIAFGGGAPGMLELRFVSPNNDLREADTVVTSGLDGVYPAGLPVGKIVKVQPSESSAAFERALVAPTAELERSRAILVLLVDRTLQPPPIPEAPEEGRSRRPTRSAR